MAPRVIAERDAIVPVGHVERKVVKGKPIPPDLVDAYNAQFGDAREEEPTGDDRPIADEDGVFESKAGVTRKLVAGRPEPVGLRDDTIAPATTEANLAPHVPGAEPRGYEAMSKDELEAEAQRRGLTVEGTGAHGNVRKDDLVRALAADDNNDADPEPEGGD